MTNTTWCHLCVTSKIQQNLAMKQRVTDIESRLVAAKGKGGGKGLVWKFGIRDRSQYMQCCCLDTMSCLCDPMDCSPPGSSVHGTSQARILEWAAISFSRGCSRPRNRTCISCLAGRFFTTEPHGKPKPVYIEWINNKVLLYSTGKYSLSILS